MTVIHFAAATLFGLAAATSAYAGEPEPTAADRAPTAIIAGQAPAPTVRVKRYCISDRRENAPSRRKVCRTRDDWRARGFDPLVAIGQL